MLIVKLIFVVLISFILN